MKLVFKKILLIVLDGFGIASSSPGNAIVRAAPSMLNELINSYPSLALQAAGPNVGLPWGEPGNSEVGHMCMGAGRIVLQDLPRIDQAITSGALSKNKPLLEAFEHVKANKSSLHLVGLVGSGNVHASQLHLYALLELAASSGLSQVYLHAITDGRDTPPDAAYESVKEIEKKMMQAGVGRIASVIGRFFAMDRAQHWDLTELAFRVIALGLGQTAGSALAAIEEGYRNAVYDETIPPTVIVPAGEQPVSVKNSDAVVFFNFRSDRMIQMVRAITDPTACKFSQFYQKIPNLKAVTMTEYAAELPVAVAFPRIIVPHTLPQTIANAGLSQYHISETEKYPHVTYFFSNGHEQPFAQEKWDKVSSSVSYHELYQNVPEMSAPELTQKIIDQLSAPYDFYLTNYANPDMVGHTGSLTASMQAINAVDRCLRRLFEITAKQPELLLIITADHGTVEEVNEIRTGKIHKSHTTNPVPLILVGRGLELPRQRKQGYLYLATQVPEGLLSDVAPTILEIMHIAKPEEMTGVSLLPQLVRQLKITD